MNQSIFIPILVALPFLAALLVAGFRTYARDGAAWTAMAVAVVGFVITASLYPLVTDGGVISHTIVWIPNLGLDLIFRIDGFTWLFATLITGIGALIALYARYYMSPEDPVPRFFSFLLAFMGSMLGVVLSGNVIQLVVFWELTSLFSFLLIGYWYHNSNRARWRAHGTHDHCDRRACA